MYFIRKHDVQAELYVDVLDEAKNKSIFDRLEASKGAIEAEFGECFDWQRLEGKRACRIRKVIDIGGYRDEEEKWPAIQDAMIDAMIRLERAFKPYIQSL